MSLKYKQRLNEERKWCVTGSHQIISWTILFKTTATTVMTNIMYGRLLNTGSWSRVVIKTYVMLEIGVLWGSLKGRLTLVTVRFFFFNLIQNDWNRSLELRHARKTHRIFLSVCAAMGLGAKAPQKVSDVKQVSVYAVIYTLTLQVHLKPSTG